MFHGDKARWVRAGIASAAGVALASLGLVSAAVAAPLVLEESGSLTIHKYEDTAGIGEPGDGVNDPNIDDTYALANVTFSVQQVNSIDLTTNAGWVAAAELAEAYATSPTMATITAPGYSLGTAQTEVTGADGIANFADLPVGLYYVTEVTTPTSPDGLVPAAPFLITIPLTHPDDLDTWIYDVHVYPKNSLIKGEKEVEEGGQVDNSDIISYTITGEIPAANKSTGYHIHDLLDAKLELQDSPFVVQMINGAGEVTPLLAADYDLEIDVAGNEFLVSLTEEGLDKTFDAVTLDPTTKIQVKFNAKVVADGVIENEAGIWPNDPTIEWEGIPEEPPVHPETETKFGGIKVLKQSTTGNTPLEGAKFEVYYQDGNDEWGGVDFAQKVTNVTAADGYWTTGENGQVIINGLRYSDFAEGKSFEDGDPQYRYYWLVEVEAPEGHELLAAPVAFTVTDQVGDTINLTIDNVPSNAGFEIPLTGGTGTVLFTIAGLVLVGAAGAVAVRSRRQSARN